MQKKKTKSGSHWTIDHLPSRAKKPHRLRWKNLKSLGYPKTAEFKKNHYFATHVEAKEFAESKVDEHQRIGDAATKLSAKDRTAIIREAARLMGIGIDPIDAMREGAAIIESNGEHADIEIGSFWNEYLQRKKDSGKWGERHSRSQIKFFEDSKDSFMSQPVKAFMTTTSGMKVVKVALEKYRSPNKRNAKNTLRAFKSRMKSFLSYVAANVDALKNSTVNEIFSDSDMILPTGTRPEADNVSINTDQAKYLLSYMAERKLAGWIVFKLFTGARTLLLQQWQWSVVDWDSERIRIPKHQTKLKKNGIVYPISDIPHLKEWLEWAWEIDGKPSRDKPIVPFSQPTITNHIAMAMNAKKELFTKDKRMKIRPMDTYRNFMRSGFITYGIEEIGLGKVTKIAEDRHNLDKYFAFDSATSGESEAKKFFGLRPVDIHLTA